MLDLYWCSIFDSTKGYAFIEHFAGEGQMTSTMKEVCGPSAKLDLEYHRGMDILSSGGFACMPQFPEWNARHTNSVDWGNYDCKLRTHLVSILRGDEEGFVNWQGIKCSTWVSISRPTTLRSFFAPLGNLNLKCVREANEMVSRCALICCLVLALHQTFIIEQPHSSLLMRHPRMQWLCKLTRVSSLELEVVERVVITWAWDQR